MGLGVKLCLSVSMNSPRLGNLNDRQINTYLRTLAFLLSNAVAKLNSVMSHTLARSKLPSVDSIQSSFLEKGRPRFGCCVYYGSILGNVELYLNYPLNSCLPCKRRITRQVVGTIRLGRGEHNGQVEHNEKKRNESPHDMCPQRAWGTISSIEQRQSHELASERVPAQIRSSSHGYGSRSLAFAPGGSSRVLV